MRTSREGEQDHTLVGEQIGGGDILPLEGVRSTDRFITNTGLESDRRYTVTFLQGLRGHRSDGLGHGSAGIDRRKSSRSEHDGVESNTMYRTIDMCSR